MILTSNDVGTIITHDFTLAPGTLQSMVFCEGVLSPIFDSTAPKLGQTIIDTLLKRKLTKDELKKKLEEKGFNTDGGMKL